MTIKATMFGAGYDNLRYALINRRPFTTGGAFYGVTTSRDSGRLRGDDLLAFRNDTGWMGSTDNPAVYFVYSYTTPIAWVLADGTVHIIYQKFSVTTSKHQNKLYLLTAV